MLTTILHILIGLFLMTPALAISVGRRLRARRREQEERWRDIHSRYVWNVKEGR